DFAAISANAGGVTVTAVLTVLPAGITLASLSVSPTVIPSGTSAVGTATISGAAPAGGALVTLSSSAPALAAVPASVTVAAGATPTTFRVTAQNATSGSSVGITAAFGGVTRTASVIVTEPAPSGRQLTSLTLASTIVVGGETVQGTATLASATGDATVVTLS